MKYSSERTAIVDYPTPEAALYFDKVYCLNGNVKSILATADQFLLPNTGSEIPGFVIGSAEELKVDIWDFKEEITKEAKNILLRNFEKSNKSELVINDIVGVLDEYAKHKPNQSIAVKRLIDLSGEVIEPDFDPDNFLKNLFIAGATASQRAKGKYTVPIFNGTTNPNWIKGDDLKDGIELALLDLPVISGAEIAWEQAKEVRTDQDSLKKLRKLRLFLDDIDSDKGKSYVQDLLLKRIDDYEFASQKHGFSLKKDIYKSLISLEHIPKIIAYGVFALVSPSVNSMNALLALLTATEIGGAINEIGGITLAIKNQQMMKGIESKYQDIEYLIDIKNSFRE